MSVPKDLANCRTDIVLLFSVATHRPCNYLEEGHHHHLPRDITLEKRPQPRKDFLPSSYADTFKQLNNMYSSRKQSHYFEQLDNCILGTCHTYQAKEACLSGRNYGYKFYIVVKYIL